MAGKGRNLKIAADTLCGWRSFPEHRNPEIEQTFPFPLLFQGKGSAESTARCPVVLSVWEELPAPAGKRQEDSEGQIPLSAS